MEQYEYKIKRVNCGMFKGDEQLNEVFAYYGEEGWELVSTHFHFWMSSYDLFFKRKKQSLSPLQ